MVTINIEKKHLYLITGIFLVFLGMTFVFAYTKSLSSIPNPGHSLEEIQGYYSGDNNLGDTLDKINQQLDSLDSGCELIFDSSKSYSNTPTDFGKSTTAFYSLKIPDYCLNGICTYFVSGYGDSKLKARAILRIYQNSFDDGGHLFLNLGVPVHNWNYDSDFSSENQAFKNGDSKTTRLIRFGSSASSSYDYFKLLDDEPNTETDSNHFTVAYADKNSGRKFIIYACKG